MRAENAMPPAGNAALTTRPAKLERPLGLRSKNSGGTPFSDELKLVCRGHAREQDLQRNPSLIALIERCEDGVLENGLGVPRRTAGVDKSRIARRKPRRVDHNLLLRLSVRKADALRFPTNRSRETSVYPGGCDKPRTYGDWVSLSPNSGRPCISSASILHICS